MLFTGDNQRWAKRSAVWREGWRNLHHATRRSRRARGRGHAGPTTRHALWSRRRRPRREPVEVQPHGGPKTDLAFLGWERRVATYRPFLSYNELGAMFDEGPTKLHDAVSSVLGLDELTAAEKALKDARLERERAVKARTSSATSSSRCSRASTTTGRARRSSRCGRRRLTSTRSSEVVVAGDGECRREVELLRRVLAYEPAGRRPRSSAAAATCATRTPGRRRARRDAADRAAARRGAARRSARLPRRLPGDDVPRLRTPGIVTEEWIAAAREQAARSAGRR